MDEDAARRRVDSARVARLATVTPSGLPHLVPITFAVLGDGLQGARLVMAVDDKPKSTRQLARLRNLRETPAASALVDHYDDDWSRLWWVRLDGATAVRHDGPELQEALDALATRYRPYRAAPPPGPVIALTVARWTAWQA